MRCWNSFATLASAAELILVEGAGSPAEINLRANDIANMGFARATDCPVVLIGDIDRGGVIAQIVGTKAVLDPADAALIQGFIVNKFRGDPTLSSAGMTRDRDISPAGRAWVSFPISRMQCCCLRKIAIPRQRLRHSSEKRRVKIVAPVLPHIANFDDLDPLAAEADVNLAMITRGTVLPNDADLIILPGSKATRADMHALVAEGWDIDIKAHTSPGRKRTRPLRWLPIAGPHDCGSTRHRRTTRRDSGVGIARYRNDTYGR